jgi:hypothetical protein
VGEAEQQFDQLPCANHLCDQIEGYDHRHPCRRHGPNRRRLETIGNDIGEGEPAEIA